MENEKFEIQGIIAANIPNAVEQIRRENGAMIPPFSPIKDEWLMCEKMEESVQLQRQSYKTLQAIEENTANLRVLVDLIHNSNENQNEIISLLSEIQMMAKAKDSEEAGSLYKRVMSKLAGTVKDAETLQKLVSYAGIIYDIVQGYFSN